MIELPGMPYAEAASLALLHFLWEGALLAAAAAISLRALARSSAHTRYAVACGFLVAMLLAPAATFVAVLPGAPAAAPSGAFAPQPVQPGGGASIVPQEPGWFARVLVFWAVGVVFFGIRAAGGWTLAVWQLSSGRTPARAAIQARMRALASRLRVRQAVRVFESSRAAVPAVFGAMRPIIVLPASAVTGLPPAQLEAILAHELAHVARHDFLVNCMQSAVEVLLFYHPAVWWLSERIRQEREMCCDAVAAAICGDRVLYSRALLALEEQRQEFAVAATGGNLKRRIERLLRQPAGAHRPSALVAALAAFAAVAVTVSAVALSAPPAQEQRTESRYEKWATEDAAYIMTAEERARWSTLRNDEEREQFIKQFWLRRDPDPSTPRNEVKEEHYRRIAYANERFRDDRPGWKTDRGRIYIINGPPDEAEVYPTERYEIWRYSRGPVFEFFGQRYELGPQREKK